MSFAYNRLLRPLLFSLDSETAHRVAMWGLKTSAPLGMTRLMGVCCETANPALATTCFGLRFPNPVGLAAGFDKNAELPGLWPAFGFGHVELGTVTRLAQPGNPKPRLFRLVRDRALINRMGFNNIGSDAFYEILAKHRAQGLPAKAIYGINIGKSKVTPLADAAREYAATFAQLAPLADYVTINVSSPNTPGLRGLQDKAMLKEISAAVQSENRTAKPILVKIAPDLSLAQIDDILELVADHRLSGIIATNTTTSREGLSPSPYSQEAGGVSGAPLKQRGTEIIRHIATQTRGKLPIIGVGGVESAEDAYEKIKAGASLVQLYTGFIYGGPFTAKKINRGLIRLLEREGLKTVQEAVGKGP